MRAGGSGKGGRGGGGGKGGGKGGSGGRGGGGRTDTPIHRAILPAQIGVSAYRRICLLDRRIGVFAPGSAYRRIGVFFPRTGISASGVPAYARIGVSQPRPPTVVSAYRRMCPLRAMRRRIGVSAQGGFATLFAGTLKC